MTFIVNFQLNSLQLKQVGFLYLLTLIIDMYY